MNRCLLGVALWAAASCLSAQESPIIYYGPYELPSAAQFEGEWTRSDGTYRMQITTEEGDLKARYFNPTPIHVESASLVKSEDGGLRLQVILRDEGYPGSTYELEYIPQYRVLAGSYAIPGQAPAEVYFTQ